MPSGIVVRRGVPSAIPSTWSSHAQALCKITPSGPQTPSSLEGCWYQVPPTFLDDTIEGLRVFSSPSQQP